MEKTEILLDSDKPVRQFTWRRNYVLFLPAT